MKKKKQIDRTIEKRECKARLGYKENVLEILYIFNLEIWIFPQISKFIAK